MYIYIVCIYIYIYMYENDLLMCYATMLYSHHLHHISTFAASRLRGCAMPCLMLHHREEGCVHRTRRFGVREVGSGEGDLPTVSAGWWLGQGHPSEKYESIGMVIPNIWEKKKCCKPPTRQYML